MSTPRGHMDVKSFWTTAEKDPDWRVRVDTREDMSAAIRDAGVTDVGDENRTVLILLGIDGEATDVIATDTPNWKPDPTVPPAQADLYEQLLDARAALNIAIAAMEAGQ